MTPFKDDEPGSVSGEPVKGLPEPLPEGETILWQGQPGAWALAIHAYHIRPIAAYLVVMIAWRMASQSAAGAQADTLAAIALSGVVLGLLGLAIVVAIAWATARSAIFTLTQKRIVMRYGVAIRKYVNLPLARLTSADLKMTGKDHGDIALTTTGKGVGYIYLWPFARPLKLVPAIPSLRAVPYARQVAGMIGDAYAAQHGRVAPALGADSASAPVQPATEFPPNAQPA